MTQVTQLVPAFPFPAFYARRFASISPTRALALAACQRVRKGLLLGSNLRTTSPPTVTQLTGTLEAPETPSLDVNLIIVCIKRKNINGLYILAKTA